MNIKQLILAASILPLSLAIAPKAVLAHSIETNYQVVLGEFELQTTFGSGEAFPNAPITVYSPENPNEPLLIGRTDKDGKFSFRPDTHEVGNWKVEIGKSDDNHWDRLIVPVNETGIDADAISELPTQPKHQHDYFAYSFLASILSLGAIFAIRKPNQTSDLEP